MNDVWRQSRFDVDDCSIEHVFVLSAIGLWCEQMGKFFFDFIVGEEAANEFQLIFSVIER